jgi:CheY-like chemotaxis protein
LDAPELIRRLSRQTKISVLTAEAQTGQLSTSEMSELLDLVATDQTEKTSLAAAVLGALTAAGNPPGRVEDLRKAFGLTGGTVRQPAASLGSGAASQQQTRPVHLPFRAPFEAETIRSPVPPSAVEPPIQPVPPPIPAPAPPSLPTAPRAPLPVRGKAAEILSKGVAGTRVSSSPPAPPPTPAAQEPARPAGEQARKAETFFGGATGGTKALGLGSAPGTGVGRPVVLLADDDKRIRMVFRIKLEEKGFTVIEAADGQDAWKRLDSGIVIHAVVLDMKMPGLHGLEILSRLADSGKNLPVVICTAYDHMEDEFVVATYPRLRYLTKPVDAGHLADTITNLLADQG